jgi:hypothetical protein
MTASTDHRYSLSDGAQYRIRQGREDRERSCPRYLRPDQ